ncbi:hypothetical protein [Corynebacterium lactis]|uniref:Uncharacterized protein n=1 Tax=Corynebacterium lactis RW2-5 TaxID=1408189 RepID=A0A0K2GZ23_9CORY|nr:hypothetical protein [Corynebacterium lactis]ALA66928.1 hypothetical protein CLAC_03460 [Corynebacterium lactis RW2-5]
MENNTEKMESFDLLDALSVNAGEPVTATLLGVDVIIRRNFTGDEVHKFMTMHTVDNAGETIKDQLAGLVDALSASPEKEQAALVDKILSLTVPEIIRVAVRLGQIAGLRDEAGNFLNGAPAL